MGGLEEMAMENIMEFGKEVQSLNSLQRRPEGAFALSARLYRMLAKC